MGTPQRQLGERAGGTVGALQGEGVVGERSETKGKEVSTALKLGFSNWGTCLYPCLSHPASSLLPLYLSLLWKQVQGGQ